MDKATIRHYVFEILQKTPQTHFHAIENDLRRLDESYNRQDVLTLQEVLWELLVQGVLAPGKNSLNLNLPFVHITEYGSQCLEDGRILTHDPDGYIKRFVKATGDKVDSFVLDSVRGALAVFLAGSWASSVILLARVAEHLFDRIAETVAQSGQPDGQGTEGIERSPYFARSRAQDVIRAVQSRAYLEKLSESIEPQLNGLLALIQLSRSKDGSPRWPQSSRDQVLGFFLLLPEQCAFVYHLLDSLTS
ncbi:hypothetical protein ACFLSG_00755 [Candidatus Bipolaricaulota bacterium]